MTPDVKELTKQWHRQSHKNRVQRGVISAGTNVVQRCKHVRVEVVFHIAECSKFFIKKKWQELDMEIEVNVQKMNNVEREFLAGSETEPKLWSLEVHDVSGDP